MQGCCLTDFPSGIVPECRAPGGGLLKDFFGSCKNAFLELALNEQTNFILIGYPRQEHLTYRLNIELWNGLGWMGPSCFECSFCSEKKRSLSKTISGENASSVRKDPKEFSYIHSY